MRPFVLNYVCSWLLGLTTFAFLSAFSAYPSFSAPSQSFSSHQVEILDALQQANVVYLGETHNQLDDHQAQLRIIQALQAENPRIAIALEMFQRPYQFVLDQYLAGEITEEQLIQDSQYEQRWGFPWEYYADILRFAQQNNLPLLALNTPTEVTRKVAKLGLQSLTTADQEYIPDLAEISMDHEPYRQMLLEIFQQHSDQTDNGVEDNNENQFNHFFAAQVLWDETMAETIARFLQSKPDYQVIVIVGQGHVVYDYGIPSRVERRLNSQPLIQHSVLFQSPQEDTNLNPKIADFIWRH
ncbi:MAG: ChaN family lipoprotein [Microcoleaceae cyanobacterium]